MDGLRSAPLATTPDDTSATIAPPRTITLELFQGTPHPAWSRPTIKPRSSSMGVLSFHHPPSSILSPPILIVDANAPPDLIALHASPPGPLADPPPPERPAAGRAARGPGGGGRGPQGPR
ncbi:hypothetical protein HDU96_004866, partial [Phlyctochytrium bullatum]